MKRFNRARVERGMHNKKDGFLQWLLQFQEAKNKKSEVIQVPIDESTDEQLLEIERIQGEIVQYQKEDIEYIKREYYLRLLKDDLEKMEEYRNREELITNGKV